MERTDLREQFFAETHRDPYAYMVAHVYGDAWADGYERGLRDAVEALAVPCDHDEANVVGADDESKRAPQVLVDLLHAKTHADRRHDAVEHLTEKQNAAQARLVIALAAAGHLIDKRLVDRPL